VKTAEQAEQWLKQVADCYSAAAQNSPGDAGPYQRLVEWRDRIARQAPGSPLAGYFTFREMSADYAAKLAKPGKPDELSKTQDAWREKLKAFVETYPSAEDAPDALMQLGMVNEFVNKETEAKNWYELLARNYPKSPLAAKAAGALKRLTSDGKVLELTAPQVSTGAPFDIAQHRGKVVVIYYWASWNQQCAADFLKLKALTNSYGSKGLEVVTVNLDNAAQEAVSYLQQTPAPGTHLYLQPGGLDGALATHYGVMVLPNLFLVGRDGKVVSHNVQMGGLEDEVKKLMDK
jgi:thiol-disulfide isomerase/thioredoxin